MKSSIRYSSTNRQSPAVSFREAMMKGLAPDGGLFMPDYFPQVSKEELKSLQDRKYYEIAFHILQKYLSDEISNEDLLSICKDAYDFEVPLEHAADRKFIMRLDQGPTASFKDFAARIMSRLMQYFLQAGNKHLTILTATSGDTGSAVASAFYGLENIKVIILFPLAEVSPIQRKQMTTLQKNINVLGINGKFDDCQGLVKKAFNDNSLKHLGLSSANSINIGRLIPQSVYYFHAWLKLAHSLQEMAIFSVPSGNFGNLTAGLIAKKMGLPVKKFIVATNENNEVPEFLKSGIYRPISPSRNCISNAMNVGHPSNLPRMVALYGGIMNEKGIISKDPDLSTMRDDMTGISVTDEETRESIRNAYMKYKIILEPHGAISWRGVTAYLDENRDEMNDLFISLETAHPAKFGEELKQILGIDPELPFQLQHLVEKKENLFSIGNNYSVLKEFIIQNS